MKKVHILFTFSRRRKQNTAPFASWLQQRVISTVADSNIDHDPCSDIRLLNEKKKPFHFHQARKAHFGTQPAKGLGNRAQCE